MTAKNDDLFMTMFGESGGEMPVELRGWRFRVSGGDYAICHPQATGEHVINVQQVPVTVAASTVLNALRKVAVIRKPSRDYKCVVVNWTEIEHAERGKILR